MLYQNIFPIQGPLRETLFILEWLVVFFALQWAVLFLIRIKTQKGSLKSLQEKAYIWLFLGYSLMWVFIIIADYNIVDPELRVYVLNIGFIIQVISVCIFVIIMERYKTFIRKSLFSVIFLSIAVLYFLVLLFFIDFGAIMSSFFWPIFFFFFILYLKELVDNSYIKRDVDNFKELFLRFFTGILFVGIGYQFTTRIIIATFGLEFRLIGDLLQILGLGFLSLFFFYIPSFSEYDWQQKIESLYVLHSSGSFMYKKQFQKEGSKLDDNLVTGILTGISMLIQNVSKERGTLILEKEGKTLIIYPGEFITGIIISELKLESLEILLGNFIQKLEISLYNLLRDWDGDLSLTNVIDQISRQFFT